LSTEAINGHCEDFIRLDRYSILQEKGVK